MFSILSAKQVFSWYLTLNAQNLVSFWKALLQIWSECQLPEWVSFTLHMNHVCLRIELDCGWENYLSIGSFSTPPCIQLDWKGARNRYFEVFWHFLFWLRKEHKQDHLAEKGKSFKQFQLSEKVQLSHGSNITVDYWQGQGRLAFLWILVPIHFIHCKWWRVMFVYICLYILISAQQP